MVELSVEWSSAVPMGTLEVRLAVPRCSALVVEEVRVDEVEDRRRGRRCRHVVVVELEVSPV